MAPQIKDYTVPVVSYLKGLAQTDVTLTVRFDRETCDLELLQSMATGAVSISGLSIQVEVIVLDEYVRPCAQGGCERVMILDAKVYEDRSYPGYTSRTYVGSRKIGIATPCWASCCDLEEDDDGEGDDQGGDENGDHGGDGNGASGNHDGEGAQGEGDSQGSEGHAQTQERPGTGSSETPGRTQERPGTGSSETPGRTQERPGTGSSETHGAGE